MASFLKIDSTNLVQDGYNSSWRYSFPGSAADFRDVACAIQSISLYNSEYNIDSMQFQNTIFKVEVPTAGTTSTISISLPDGYYSYADINRSIQAALVSAGAYLIDPSGNNVFYIQVSENSVYYAAQFDFSPTPTAVPTTGGTWSRPTTGLYSSGGAGLPTTTRVPRVIIDNAAFGSVVGLSVGTYPSAPATVASAQLSNIIPQIHPTSSYIVRCDLIRDEYVASGDILSAFDADIGQLITYRPSQYAWMNCHNGARSTITITIYDQNDKRVKFRDTSVSIMLLLRPKK